MPYAILRFQKRKASGVAACERHNERKKEAYKSNPDIDMERSKNNYHLVKPPRYTYKKEINRMVAEAGCRTRKDSVMMVETLITASPEFMNSLPPEEQKAYFTNEMYSADVSVKIKSAYRARFQQGKFMGTTAPYGYVKDPADHNHLLIDDKVAHVVREIFDLALAGNGIAKIRKHINKQHILRPAAYAVTQGAIGYERHFEDNEENRLSEREQHKGNFKKPDICGKPCRLQADCRQHEKQETPL